MSKEGLGQDVTMTLHNPDSLESYKLSEPGTLVTAAGS